MYSVCSVWNNCAQTTQNFAKLCAFAWEENMFFCSSINKLHTESAEFHRICSVDILLTEEHKNILLAKLKHCLWKSTMSAWDHNAPHGIPCIPCVLCEIIARRRCRTTQTLRSFAPLREKKICTFCSYVKKNITFFRKTFVSSEICATFALANEKEHSSLPICIRTGGSFSKPIASLAQLARARDL